MVSSRRALALFTALCMLCVCLGGCEAPPDTAVTLDTLPPFSGEPYVVLENNQPLFTEEELTDRAFEEYSPLDLLGRCGAATACIGREIMPTEERGSIGSVKPSGWQTLKFDCVDGKYLYNRCHLIGYQLTGENTNEQNLITGTRYLNIEGMLPFENMVADYIKETGHHVMYRVTPIYDGTDLLASGVQMEAYSVEDNGEGICFHVYCYNMQPGIVIDHATGNATEDDTPIVSTTAPTGEGDIYILNTGSKKIHRADCGSAGKISQSNKKEYEGSLDELLAQGYETAGCCFD